MSASQLLPSDTAATLSLLDAPVTVTAGIVSRQVLRTAEARVTLFQFDAGQELTAHTNARRALVQILTGTAEFFFNDGWQALPAGTLLHLPPHAPHAVRATAPFTMLLTLCGEPAA